MNTDNLEYLQNQLKFLGFGEGLNSQLERQLTDGAPEFHLQASHVFGKDTMEATLHFKKSDQEGKDFYFFNSFDAVLLTADKSVAQHFFINNKGQSVTFKEACNLLNGRAVYKELTPKEGEKYKAWIKLDFAHRDEKGNAQVKYFNEKYGFDLKEAIGRLPFKELSDPDQMQTLMASLQKGNAAQAILIKDGKEQSVLIAADPQFKTLKMYDGEGKKLYVPVEKVAERYGLSQADQKRQEQAQTPEKDLKTNKKKDLLPRKERKPSARKTLA